MEWHCVTDRVEHNSFNCSSVSAAPKMIYVFSVSNETPEENLFKILNSEPLIEKHFRYYFFISMP